ncbi:hypothetical protein KMC50_gp43 [Ralstonia phage Claudette]|uniref:Uncharacterized protein n=2 Tax=Gervaisevirus claudettte TaxID=2846041 RepID=A0A7G5B866_9CAUD|nr:hypothetical protein KMC50_gp43 [Ralstonia phage Claudette]QMV32489.1 hypothetical protein 20A_00040 [Ralstonia phage Alix]QMV32750.1 hypothetical protein 20Ca_00043 [Ralstonia phage Claudette]
MTFNRDSSCYRATPRSLQTSKFGCYSTLSTTRRRGIGSVICYAAVAVSAVLIALVLSGCDEAPQNVTGKDGCTVIYTYYGADRQFVRCGGRGAVVPRMDGKIGRKPVTIVSAR